MTHEIVCTKNRMRFFGCTEEQANCIQQSFDFSGFQSTDKKKNRKKNKQARKNRKKNRRKW